MISLQFSHFAKSSSGPVWNSWQDVSGPWAVCLTQVVKLSNRWDTCPCDSMWQCGRPYCSLDEEWDVCVSELQSGCWLNAIQTLEVVHFHINSMQRYNYSRWHKLRLQRIHRLKNLPNWAKTLYLLKRFMQQNHHKGTLCIHTGGIWTISTGYKTPRKFTKWGKY